MKVETLILVDAVCKDGKKLCEKIGDRGLLDFELAHVENGGFLENYDDVIKAVEAHFLQDYGVEMHYLVEFDVLNQDEICAKFA